MLLIEEVHRRTLGGEYSLECWQGSGVGAEVQRDRNIDFNPYNLQADSQWFEEFVCLRGEFV